MPTPTPEEVKQALREKGVSEEDFPTDEQLQRRLARQSGESADQQAAFWAARARTRKNGNTCGDSALLC